MADLIEGSGSFISVFVSVYHYVVLVEGYGKKSSLM